jgi:transposase
VHVAVQRDTAAIQAAERRLGWRVYGTNRPASALTLAQAVLAYRDEYLVERSFGRLKGRSLSLTPMYLADDDRATGLIRWLTVGLRVLTLLEGVVRRRLRELGEQVAGLYAGNPNRATAHPTAESLLRAFKGLALSFVTVAGQTYRHITPLSEVQHKILRLLDYWTLDNRCSDRCIVRIDVIHETAPQWGDEYKHLHAIGTVSAGSVPQF